MLNFSTTTESHFEITFQCRDELLKDAILRIIQLVKDDSDSWYFDTLSSSFLTIQKIGNYVTFTMNMKNTCGAIARHTVTWNDDVKKFIIELLETSLI